MNGSEFREWLTQKGKSGRYLDTLVSDAKRINASYGGLDENFMNDNMESIINSLRYTTADRHAARPNPSKIDVPNIYMSLPPYLRAAVLYREFLVEKSVSPPIAPRDILTEIIDAEPTLFGLGSTEREAIIQARLGQGHYRDNLLRKWNGQCSVTGFNKSELLRASHIKPWRCSSNGERLDVENGLLLTPNLDAAFDAGLITFKDDGLIDVSSRFWQNQWLGYGLLETMRVSNLTEKLRAYLCFHRKNVFR